MSRPDRDDVAAARERRQVDLAKGRRDLRPDAAPVRPDTIAWVPSSPPPPPTRTRGRRVALLVLAVAVVAATVTTFSLWPGGSTPPGTPAAAASPSATSGVTLTATDRLLRAVAVGQCLAMTDRLDQVADPATEVVPCTSAAATFTVTEVNQKLKARAPCRSDTFIRSRAAGRVACLDRFLQQGQCILGNGAQRFLLSAVPCDTDPVTPFSQVFRIRTLNQTGRPVMCAPPLVLETATPNRSMCLAEVG